MIHPTRASLLSRLRDPADAAAWGEFQDRYRDLLLRFCRARGLQAADAEDAVQSVFASIARAMPSFTYDPARGRFRDYLFKSVRNAISALRCPNHAPTPLAAVEHTPAPQEEADLWEQQWTAHHYRLAMQTLERTYDQQSLAIFQHALAGLSPAHTAARLGISIDAVYKARQRVRDRLQELVAQQIKDEEERAA